MLDSTLLLGYTLATQNKLAIFRVIYVYLYILKYCQINGYFIERKNYCLVQQACCSQCSQIPCLCARWRAGELTATAAMQEVGLKPNTFYRRIKELGL